ncbi:unnamed protein product, partial [marine sediment metagenome]
HAIYQLTYLIMFLGLLILGIPDRSIFKLILVKANMKIAQILNLPRIN